MGLFASVIFVRRCSLIGYEPFPHAMVPSSSSKKVTQQGYSSVELDCLFGREATMRNMFNLEREMTFFSEEKFSQFMHSSCFV